MECIKLGQIMLSEERQRESFLWNVLGQVMLQEERQKEDHHHKKYENCKRRGGTKRRI